MENTNATPVQSTQNRYGRALDRLQDKGINAGEAPLLGAVCWFDLSSGASRAVLDRLINNMPDPAVASLIRSMLPSEPTPVQSFAYAISNAATGLKGVQVTKLEQDKSKVVAAILQREETDNGGAVERVDFVQRCRVAMLLTDRAGNELPNPAIVHETPGDPVGQRIESLFQWHRDYLTPDDLRPLCTGVFEKCDRLTMRKAGGMYFVPDQYLHIVRELFALLKDVKSAGYMLPIFESADALDTLTEAANSDALDEIAILLDEIKRFDEQLDEGKALRGSTLQARLDKLDDLRSKSSLYARLLRNDQDELEQSFADAEQKLLTLITKRDNA